MSRSHAPLGGVQTGAPMERVAMDILGPLPLTYQGNRYVLVVMDLFTKWTEAYPLPDQEAKTVAKVFVNEFVCRYGTPLQILTDQGTNFESQLFKEMCIFLHIDKVRTSTNHPQANGGVEQFNRTLAQMLTMYCQNKQSWDEYLPQVMMAYRSAMHSTTHYSPNKMLFGREIMLPLEVMVGHPEQENKQNNSYCEYI
jgi:transposase InsO family protein